MKTTNTNIKTQTTVPLDFLYSDDPVILDRGIRESIRGIALLVLTTGLGLVKIKADKLFIGLGFKNLTAYIEDLAKTTNHDRATVFSWLKIGETYIKYRTELDEIGFNEGDGVTKLVNLEKALMTRGKKEVFDNLKKMSQRDFRVYANSGRAKAKGKPVFWEIRGNILFINGQRAIILNTHLNERTAAMLRKAICMVCRALEKDGVIVAVHLRNLKELRRFTPKALRLRERIQRG